MNGFLVPANAKKGTLILNLFRPFDLILFGTGIAVTLFLLLLIPSTNILLVLLCCLPAAVTGFLVIPIANYHNVLVAIQSIIHFYTERRKYTWKGWCFYEQFATEDKSRSRKK